MSQCSLLIADDNLSEQKTLRELLGTENFSFSSAINGKEAMEKIRKETPDLLLLDTQSQNINSFELLRQIRVSPEFKKLPIVIIVTKENRQIIEKNDSLSVDGIVDKPFENDELMIQIRRILGFYGGSEKINLPRDSHQVPTLVQKELNRDQLIFGDGKKDRILKGVASAANYLLTVSNFTLSVNQALATLGEYTDADRVYIFRNHLNSKNNEPLMSICYEWVKTNIVPQINNPELRNLPYSPTFDRLYLKIEAGDIFLGNIKILSLEEQALSNVKGNPPTLIIPIFVRGELWGFIGFDVCIRERGWTSSELSILQTVACSFGGAIGRRLSEKQLQESENRLIAILNSIQAGVMLVKLSTEQIVEANLFALKLIGAEKENVIGEKYQHYIISKEKRNNDITDQRLHGIEYTLLTLQGQQIPIIKNSVEISIENNKYIIETFMSIADLRRAEQIESEQILLAEALRDTANILTQSLNLREVLDCILTNIGRVVPNDAGNIMLIDDGAAHMAACRGYENLGGEERVMGQVRAVKDVPNLQRMVDSGRPIVVPDTKQSPEWVPFKTSDWILSYVSAPICHKGKPIGFLNLNSSISGFYTQEHAARLLAFADQAAIAIENARLYERAQNEIGIRRQAEKELQEAKYELEVRVEKRTSELRKANEQLLIELSKRKQAETALEAEHTMLATRIEERTAELSAANAELAKASQLKDSFLASMSHELRTPLNAILNISETLQEQVYGELNNAQMRSVRTVEESGRHLLALINDILDLSKIGAGKFEITRDEVSIQAVCQTSLQIIEEAVRKKGLILTTHIDPNFKTVWADHRRLKQILVNLLSNAVKFTPQGGTIGLEVIGDQEKKQIQFIVWDTGIGIPEDSLIYLFKPFVQLDNSLSRQYEGTGLGLALVYHIVELHGGGIRIESALGKGSRFTVTLSLEVGGREKPGFSIDAHQTFNPDDEGPSDPITRITRYLYELGIETEEYLAKNGSVLNESAILSDFIVIDEGLLEPNDVMNQLKQITKIQRSPIIIVRYQTETFDSSQLPGHIGLLSFPFNRRELRNLIKNISGNGTASLCRKATIIIEDVQKSPSESPVILIVDDNETAIRLIGDYLKVKGYLTIAAYNGAEAIERAREKRPHLILMDIQMPGIDGLEAIRRIRADEKIKNTPIIALTALAMQRDREICLQTGANEYFSKPVSMRELVEKIEAQLEKKPV